MKNKLIKMKGILRLLALFLFIGVIAFINNRCSAPSEDQGANLEAGFKNPPETAKPRVWWHWMNGNITKKGIKEDLMWMHRVGIGGFQNFDAALATPQIVKKRLAYMTPDWKDAFHYATELADSLGLEMAIAGSPGWSESGGSWVPAKDGMKKYVWSQMRVNGGQDFSGKIPSPPTTTGTFQNLPVDPGFSMGEIPTPPEYYHEIGVYAYRLPATDVSMKDLNPKITSSGGKFDLTSLTDGDLVKTTLLPPVGFGKKAWVQFEFSSPQAIKSLTMVSGGSTGGFPGSGGQVERALESSNDGINFSPVISIPSGGATEKTIDFNPVTAKYFRFTFIEDKPGPNMFAMLGFGNAGQEAKPQGVPVAELVLHTTPRVDRFEDKAAFSVESGLEKMKTPTADPSDVISKDDVIDLTAKMDSTGMLNWSVPEGKWMIVRMGYSLTGKQNHPATYEATGLEVDKLDPVAVTNYFNNYLDQYKDATQGLMGNKGLQYVITDSWEAGAANWTGNMMKEFAARRGYDMLPWIPVLTGRIVQSSEASERFLWDFRITLAEMLAEYHYDELTKILQERDMRRYSESHESGRAFIGDGMDVKRTAAVPMSAMWVPGGFGGSEQDGVAIRYRADVRESASVAHIYGQNIVAAESMTAIGNTWAYSPQRLKPTADMELANGLNRFVIHTSVHQPVDDKIPGLGLGPFGQWFTRHETWAEEATPWVSYLARSSYMLQQGKFVADVLYIYGQDHNITSLFGNKLPDVPEDYNYDFLNAGAISKVLSFQDNKLMTPGGTSYNLLALDSSTRYMSLPVLKKIQELVNEGAVVTGPKPLNSPSLTDDENEFKSIADELWGAGAGVNTVGKGKVYSGKTIAEVLADMKILPDFTYTKPSEDTKVMYVHRKLGNTDIYWVNNRKPRYENIEATFRVTGKAPEIWNPQTGDIKDASYTINDENTTIPLNLKPNDAVFIVFRKDAEASSKDIPVPKETKIADIQGPWKVTFEPNRGAPAETTLESLTPWNENSDPGIKYFSGTGTYTKTIQAPEDWFKEGAQLWLDLGSVKNLAEVNINGKSLGIVWKIPFKVNATDVLKPGENTLEIKVTDLWVNRLIGDQQPGVTNKISYTTQAFYQANSPLLPSGLLGPVTISQVE